MTEAAFDSSMTDDKPASISILFKLRKANCEPERFAGMMSDVGIKLTKRRNREAAAFFYGRLHLGMPPVAVAFAAAMKPTVGTIISLRAPASLPTGEVELLRGYAQVWFDQSWSILND